MFSARAQPAGCGEELFDAAANGDLEAVLLLLDLGAPTEWADEYGSTVLHGTSNRAVAEALLLCGAEVDARMDDQSTPLINAAYSGRSEVLPALFKEVQIGLIPQVLVKILCCVVHEPSWHLLIGFLRHSEGKLLGLLEQLGFVPDRKLQRLRRLT